MRADPRLLALNTAMLVGIGDDQFRLQFKVSASMIDVSLKISYNEVDSAECETS